LLVDNVSLSRGVVVALGHDEEVGGFGARSMAKILGERGVRPSLVLDEGGMIAMFNHSNNALVKGGPFALVGTAEKTAMNFELTLEGVGGHGSLPPRAGLSAASKVAQLIQGLERTPMPTRLEAPMVDMLKAVAQDIKLLPLRWLFQRAGSPLLKPIFGQLLGLPLFGSKINALVRSTMGIVEVRAGDGAQNVLPRTGHVGVNVRTLPGDSAANVESYLKAVSTGLQAKIEDVSAVVYPQQTVTSAESDAFQVVKRVIIETLSHRRTSPSKMREAEDAVVEAMSVYPFLLTGMTDSRWYHDLAPNRIVRFSPFALRFDELSMIHGVDERVAVVEYFDAVRFYSRIITSS
jgi:carboxypeptidase PM20D1